MKFIYFIFLALMLLFYQNCGGDFNQNISSLSPSSNNSSLNDDTGSEAQHPNVIDEPGEATGVRLQTKTITSMSPYIDPYDDLPSTPEHTGDPYCEAPEGSICYYIAPNGDDNNPGDFNQPLASTTELITRLKAGDVVYFRGGEYTDKNAAPSIVYWSNPDMESLADIQGIDGEKGKPIVFRNYPKETPVIDLYKINPDFDPNSLDGEPRFAIRIKNASYIRISGLEIVHGSILVDGTNTGGNTHHIYLDNNHIHDFLANSSNTGLIRVSSADQVHIRNNKLHDVYERKIKENGEWVLNTTKSHYDAIHNGCVTTLSGDTYEGYGINSTGSITVVGNEFFNCPMAFFFKNPQGQILDENGYNSIIYKNHFYDNGILAYYSLSNSLFEQNLVQNTSTGLYNTGKGEDIEDPKMNEINSRNITFKNNVFIGMSNIASIKGIGYSLEEGLYSELYQDHFKFINNIVVMKSASNAGNMSWSQGGYIFSNKYDGMADQQATPSKTLSKIVSTGNCYASSKGEDLAFMKQFILDAEGSVDKILGYTHQEAHNMFNIDGSEDRFTEITDINKLFKDPASNDFSLSETSPCK